MSIYSANRTGSMTLSQVPANEAYGCNDLGRILYESQLNDQTLFEAILASDFREIHGLREGTLLESEIKSINEASFRTIIAGLKERLKRIWAKIKAAFKDAMTKIAAYVLNDGKAFVKNFWNTYNKYQAWTGSLEVKRYEPRLSIEYIANFGNIIEEEIRDSIAEGNKKIEGKSKNDIIQDLFVKKIYGKEIELSKFVNTVVEGAERTKTVKASNLNELCEVVSSGRAQIKDLKKAENSAKNNIDKMGKALTDAEAKSNSEDASNNISAIATLISVGETLLTYDVRAAIAVIKHDMKSCRAALGQVMSDLRNNGTKKDKKTLGELAILEAADELDAAFDDTAVENIDSETQDAIDDLISDEV